MMQYSEHKTRDLRLVMLKSLSKQPGWKANETVLQIEAEAFGHACSRDVIRTEMRKLEELGAVAIGQAGSVLVATLTRRGKEHVEARTVIDGVNQPSPEV